MTLGLAATFKIFQNPLCLGVFFLPNSFQQTQTLAFTKMRAVRNDWFLVTVLTFSLLWHLHLIFHDFPWPTIKFNDLPDLEDEILQFHDFSGFPWPVRTLKHALVRKTIWNTTWFEGIWAGKGWEVLIVNWKVRRRFRRLGHHTVAWPAGHTARGCRNTTYTLQTCHTLYTRQALDTASVCQCREFREVQSTGASWWWIRKSYR